MRILYTLINLESSMHTTPPLQPIRVDYIPTASGNRPPFQIQLQVTPTVSPYLQQLGARVCEDIQANANASVVRQSLYYRMSHNRFSNNDYLELVMFAAEIMHAAMVVKGLTPDAAMSEAVTDAVGIAAASEPNMPGNERMWPSLPPGLQQAITDWIAHFKQVQALIQHSRQINSTGYPQAQPQYGQSYGQPFAQPQPQYGQPFGQPQPQPYYQNPQPQYGQPNPHAGLAHNPISRVASTPTSRNFNEPSLTNVRAGGARSNVVAAAVPTPPKPEVLMQPVIADGYVQQLKDLHEGKPLPDGVFCAVYWLRRSVAYFSYVNGVATNFVVDKDQCTMRYTDHANERLLRSRSGFVSNLEPRYAETDKVLEAMSQQRTVEDLLVEFELKQVEGAVTTDVNVDIVADVSISCLVNLNNSTDYHGIADDAFNLLGLNLSVEDSLVSYTGVNFGPKPYESTVVIENDLRVCKTHTGLQTGLDKIRRNAALYYWESIDNDVTAYANELLQTTCGVDLRMDCYTDEVEELLEMLDKDNPDAYDVFTTICLRKIQTVVLDNNSTQLWRDVSECTDGDGKTCLSRAIVEDISLLPVTSTDLDLGCMQNVGLVSARHTPSLYKAARHRIDNAHPRTRWIKFITLDKVVLYIYDTIGGGVLIANQPF